MLDMRAPGICKNSSSVGATRGSGWLGLLLLHELHCDAQNSLFAGVVEFLNGVLVEEGPVGTVWDEAGKLLVENAEGDRVGVENVDDPACVEEDGELEGDEPVSKWIQLVGYVEKIHSNENCK